MSNNLPNIVTEPPTTITSPPKPKSFELYNLQPPPVMTDQDWKDLDDGCTNFINDLKGNNKFRQFSIFNSLFGLIDDNNTNPAKVE